MTLACFLSAVSAQSGTAHNFRQEVSLEESQVDQEGSFFMYECVSLLVSNSRTPAIVIQ